MIMHLNNSYSAFGIFREMFEDESGLNEYTRPLSLLYRTRVTVGHVLDLLFKMAARKVPLTRWRGSKTLRKRNSLEILNKLVV